MTDWITDRRPTVADGYGDGNVRVRDSYNSDSYRHLHWSFVGGGAPCQHCAEWQPPTAEVDGPPLLTKLALALGQRWRRRDGEVVTIDRHDTGDTGLPFHAGHSWYCRDGKHCSGREDLDLIELLPSAEPPTPTPPLFGKIPQAITTGAAPFYVLVVGDDSSNGNGEPIVFETQLPVGSTLQAVLQQRRRLGSRYGTTYVAECRIISELTEVPF